jgi:hypothetical protein
MQTSGAALLATKRRSLVRVLTVVSDGRCTHGLLYLAAVRVDCAPLHQNGAGALMPFLPRLGSVTDLRFDPPEILPHSALRAGDHHFP